ncbi:unnamed protein product [Miscanthus lutarioriparius]|uniref:Phospholipid/glycerol acyltransferase domain-containing protein n=1 Tax=Miscanthus lutarioriparius TaxID=422564 RepID=A0A811N0D0_9POAL|nr:unnamed protein product [Miscanthus lutarioriparius]
MTKLKAFITPTKASTSPPLSSSHTRTEALESTSSSHLSHVVLDSSQSSPGPPIWLGVQLISRVRGVCFYLVTAVAAIFLFVAMVVVHPLMLLFDRYRRRAQHYIAKIWATLTISMFYKLEVEGMENLPPNSSPGVYVANHQSFLDIYTLLTLGRCFKFISKTRWAMYLLGVIPLRHMDSRSQLDCLKRCVDLVGKGASVFFFPEDTRSRDGKLGVFKRGAFSVAAKTGAPVIPITLIRTGKLMPSGMEGILNSGSVKVIIHRPIQGNDAETLCSEARNVIADTLLLHGYGVALKQVGALVYFFLNECFGLFPRRFSEHKYLRLETKLIAGRIFGKCLQDVRGNACCILFCTDWAPAMEDSLGACKVLAPGLPKKG